mgnify:CR=1 FL=1
MEARGLTPCIGCGSLVEWRTSKRINCETCRLELKRARARRAAAVQRLKKGVKPVKGVQHKCIVCGVMYDRGVVHSHRCKKCQSEFNTERTRRVSVEKKKTKEGKAYQRAWFKRKRQTDIAFRISQHFTVLMHRALGKAKAGRSWKTFVDYSIEELMAHLERKFKQGMSWENKGDWHIDHIIPRSSFKYSSPDDTDFKKCWSLSNLQPLWAIDNIRKNAKTDYII